ncbi:MAG: hypothetical protein AAGA58_13325 [Verrucomicrobiota bacterium]
MKTSETHPTPTAFPRRRFLSGAAALTASPLLPAHAAIDPSTASARYEGPRVIIVRFGGGVRRRETIDPAHTYSPFTCKEFAKRGTLFTDMRIDEAEGVQTSHGEGTLNILTGIFDSYKDIENRIFGGRFEAKVPTVFEYLRKQFHVPEHETLIINGEDRTQEEFYSFSNHHLFGAGFKSETLSLFRFKVWLLKRDLANGKYTGKELAKKQKEFDEMVRLDYRLGPKGSDQGPEINAFWKNWSEFYGDSGFVNPRGDRLLTDISIRALHQLKPKLMMINYNDPDYVHWGNMSHYTRGISVIDNGLERLTQVTQTLDEYRDNTIFVVVPDCGRDTNPYAHVPCQHHFNSQSSREIWALLVGPGIEKNTVVDYPVFQNAIAPTIGQLMGFKADLADGSVLEQALA